MSGSIERVAQGVLDVPQHRPLGLRVDEAAQGAGQAGGHLAPVADRGVGQGERDRCGRGRAGRRTVRTKWAPSGVPRRRAVGRGAVALRVRARHDPRQGDGEGRVRPARVQDRERLHVEGRGILGGVRDLHDRQPLAGGAAQQERLVALAARGSWRSRPRRRTSRPRSATASASVKSGRRDARMASKLGSATSRIAADDRTRRYARLAAMSEQTVRAYIGLGANVGDATGDADRGRRHALAALPGVRLRAVSRLYVTEPGRRHRPARVPQRGRGPGRARGPGPGASVRSRCWRRSRSWSARPAASHAGAGARVSWTWTCSSSGGPRSRSSGRPRRAPTTPRRIRRRRRSCWSCPTPRPASACSCSRRSRMSPAGSCRPAGARRSRPPRPAGGRRRRGCGPPDRPTGTTRPTALLVRP